MEPLAKNKTAAVVSNTSFGGIFTEILERARDFSNLRFSVTLLSQHNNEKNETVIYYDSWRSHHSLVFYSVKFSNTVDELIGVF